MSSRSLSCTCFTIFRQLPIINVRAARGTGRSLLMHRKIPREDYFTKEGLWHLHICMSIQNTVFWTALPRSEELTARAKELGMDSMAITDHGVMYGVIDFYRAAREVGIKPILGCEVYVAPGSRFDRENGAGEDRYYHLVLLAENNTGYKNLMKIVSKGFVDGFYYKPRVDHGASEKVP